MTATRAARRAELPYGEDSAALFERIADLPWAVFLDSGHPSPNAGRYDILAAEPVATLCTVGSRTEIRDTQGVSSSTADPFELLKQALHRRVPAAPDLPFSGGALGYFAYDLARRLERLPQHAQDEEGLPEMAVGVYDWAVVVDHQERRCRLVGRCDDSAWDALLGRLRTASVPASHAAFRLGGKLSSNLDRAAYARAFVRIKTYIREGDCYQVNLAQRFAAPAVGSGWRAYQQLRRINPAPYSGFLSLPFVEILSTSPERFLKVRAGQVETRPIKGTRPRHADAMQDRASADELLHSAKDQAENLMIVDLLRNDLGKTCLPGSIRVPDLFAVESFATVHHLVSTVTGVLEPDLHALDLLRGCFPGGSITGAPKLRAMEIIEELEPHRRGIYCGAIGYIGDDGSMDTSIAIRTLVYSAGTIRFWAGGGIVADSRMESEYQETFDKAAAMLELVQAPDPDGLGN